MGCCSAPSNTDRSARAPQRFKKCTDPIFFILFLVSLLAGALVTKNAFNKYEPIMTSGSDSWGNVCNADNSNKNYYQYINNEVKLGNIELVDSFTDNSNFYKQDVTGQSYQYDMRYSDIEYISQNMPLLSPAYTLCLDKCPGDGIVLTDDQMAALGVNIYMASKAANLGKDNIKSLIGSGDLISQEEANAWVDKLWCNDILTNNSYTGYTKLNDLETPDEFCARNPMLLPSSRIMNMCTPHTAIISSIGSAYLNDGDKAVEKTNTNSTGSWLSDELNNVQNSFSIMKKEIITALICSIFVAIVIIFIIQVGTKYIVKILVIGFLLVSIAAIVWIWIALHVKQTRVNHSHAITMKGFPVCQGNTTGQDVAGRIFWNKLCNEPPSDENTLQNFKYLTYGVTVVCAIMILTICCCWGNIALAVELFDEAGQAVFSMIMILFQPAVTVLFLIVNYCICAYFIIICMQVKERVVINEGPNFGRSIFTSPNFNWEYAWLFILFNGFWVAVFIDGCHQVSLAGAISNWFFSEKKEKTVSCCPTLNALCDCLKYNLGSVAFGALLIAIVRTIQVIIWIIERQSQPPPGTEMGGLRKAIFACLKCCMACVEKFLAFINRNAYIGIAIYGYDFCRAAQQCLSLKVKNAGRAATTAIICAGVLVLGKLISTACTLAIFFSISSRNQAFENLSPFSVIILCVIVGGVAFIITSVFLSVYEMALDTIFICFCEDQDRNNGKDRPYFSSVRLQKFMRKNA